MCSISNIVNGPIIKNIAAVSCSLNTPRSGGVKMGLGLTGKLGYAWHLCTAWCMGGGAWVLGLA